MPRVEILYLPVGVPTFCMDSARGCMKDSIALLQELDAHVSSPEDILLSVESLIEFCQDKKPNLIIFQNTTFAAAHYMDAVLQQFSCEVVVWTLREPSAQGGRLRLNSLTGAYAAGNMLHTYEKERFQYIFGAPTESIVINQLSCILRATKVTMQLSQLNLLSVGTPPTGFEFGGANSDELLSTFGVSLKFTQVQTIMELAQGYDTPSSLKYLSRVSKIMCGLDQIDPQNQLDFAKLYRAYTEYIAEEQIGALASRCWPDFFTEYGTPVCGVLALLNDALIPSSCEGDVYGALSMYIGTQLTGRATFFGDPVSLDEAKNTLVFWHCGTAACSLARSDTGPVVGVHCNRKIGPTLEFGCVPCDKITLFRVGRKPDGTFRFFLAQGLGLDQPQQFFGCTAVIQVEHSVRKMVEDSVKDGWEPHFVVIYGDVYQELEVLGDMLGIEVCRY